MALDIIFISYDEINAEDHFLLLQEKHPYVKRVQGIKGIPAAHKEAARIAKTSNFYTIDADTIVDDNFDFSYVPEKWDKDFIHLWYARNAVNDLEYGWGGIKLWPRKILKVAGNSEMDFTTSILGLGKLKIHQDVASVSCFNSTPFETWRSAFREAVKLSRIDTEEAAQRLRIWCTVGEERPYGTYCIQGANCGKMFAEGGLGLDRINDFDWLKEEYDLSISES